MDKILIAFASRHGSTTEVAAAIATTLRERGLTVDMRPAKQVQTLTEYGGIVLGAPIYFGVWPKDALVFLTQHREVLVTRRIALFALGPTHADHAEWQASRTMLDHILSKFPWLTPVAVELFGGKYDPAWLSIPEKVVASLPASPLYGMPAGDARDWAAIRVWAMDLAARFVPTPA